MSRALVSPAATVTVPAVGDVLPAVAVTDFAGALVVADCRLILGRRDDPRSDRRPCERRESLKVAAQHTRDQEPTDNSGSLDCIAIPRMRICALRPNCMRMRPATWPRILTWFIKPHSIMRE